MKEMMMMMMMIIIIIINPLKYNYISQQRYSSFRGLIRKHLQHN